MVDSWTGVIARVVILLHSGDFRGIVDSSFLANLLGVITPELDIIEIVEISCGVVSTGSSCGLGGVGISFVFGDLFSSLLVVGFTLLSVEFLAVWVGNFSGLIISLMIGLS